MGIVNSVGWMTFYISIYDIKFHLKVLTLIDCVYVYEIRQTFYNVNTIFVLFTNVASDTILKFLVRNYFIYKIWLDNIRSK
jgi:hypothetical protein